MQVNRRLYRCRENRVLAGVASGVAEFLELDPSLVRIVWFLSIFAGGIGILLYVGMALIVPNEPYGYQAGVPGGPGETGLPAGAAGAPGVAGLAGAPGSTAGAAHNHGMYAPGHGHTTGGTGRLTMIIGGGLILFGTLALLDIALPGWATWRQLWPVVVIGLGGLLVFGALRRERERESAE
jgi:phage shock protein PspC (stress-responsive transcriptional regulator)